MHLTITPDQNQSHIGPILSGGLSFASNQVTSKSMSHVVFIFFSDRTTISTYAYAVIPQRTDMMIRTPLMNKHQAAEGPHPEIPKSFT